MRFNNKRRWVFFTWLGLSAALLLRIVYEIFDVATIAMYRWAGMENEGVAPELIEEITHAYNKQICYLNWFALFVVIQIGISIFIFLATKRK